MPDIKSVPQEEADIRLPEGIEKIERFAVEVPQLTLPSGTAGKAQLPEGLFPMSVGCALAFSSERTDGTLLFYGLTDRGPTLPAPSVRDDAGNVRPGRYFLSPMFQPRIVRIEVTPGKARSLLPVALANAEAKPFSGLPARDDGAGKTFAILSLANEELSGGLRPIDPEGLAIDPDVAFWVVDRYGPALRQFSRQGVEREVLFPGAGLPGFLSGRPGSLRSLARLADGRLVTFDRNAFGLTRFLTVIAVDPKTQTSAAYLWPVEHGVWKRGTRPFIGDAAALGDGRFLVIEQGTARDGSSLIQLVLADLSGATDVSGMPPAELQRAKRTRPGVVKRRTVLNLADIGWTAKLAKGLALLPDEKTLAILSDNRYGAEIRVENPDAPLSEPEDYVLEKDGELTLAGTRSNAKFIVRRRSPQESRTDLFLVTFGQPVSEF